MGHNPTIIIQASSRSWSGGADLCMNLVDGKTVLEHTIERACEYGDVVIVAPEFDRGNLDHLPYRLVYGHDDSPLRRMVSVIKEKGDDDRIIRVDGLHMCADFEAAVEWYKSDLEYDVAKFSDDMPPQLGCDVYRVGALRDLLPRGPEFHVHPKFAMKRRHCIHPNLSDEMLRNARDIGEKIYTTARLEVTDGGYRAGDQLRFHYELASKWVGGDTLDIACGNGFGVEMLKNSANVCGADIDPDILPDDRNFFEADVTSMCFKDDSWDCITSMETFEHVDPDKFLSEIKRVLRPGGALIMSTPQNCYGHIPINVQHIREYSLEELTDKVGQYFEIKDIVGIKAGRIVIPGDPIGNNTVLRCVNAS